MLAEINEIRELFFNDLIQKPNDFHPDDVERIKHCDWMIKRFLVSNKRNINATAKQLIQVMKWRNDERVNEIKPTQFPMEYFQSGGMFICKSKLKYIFFYNNTKIFNMLYQIKIFLKFSILIIFLMKNKILLLMIILFHYFQMAKTSRVLV